MRKTLICTFCALSAAISLASVGSDPIETALARGRDFLLSQQQEAGYWSDRQMPALTALPVWALCGVGSDTEATNALVAAAIDRGVKYVLSTQREDGGFYVPKPGRGGSGLGNYNTAVCLSALFESHRANRAALLKARAYIASSQLTGDDTMAGGFGYDKASRRRYADLSNTAYALDAMRRTESLEEGRGGTRTDVNWAEALAFVENLVAKEGPDAGGAAYNERTPQGGTTTNSQGRVQLKAYGSMTYAAVLSMCHARLDRGDPRVRQSLEYCRLHWSVEENPGMGNQGLYYFYDIMARALQAAGVEEVGGHVWKTELAARLVALQRPDGSWANENNRFWEADPVLCTSFAMLVLEICR